ncbi:methyltransferase [Phenylobacterium sp.]|jgi:predicted methyltransferase|uniref:class I SAM-dependent methyltransferase n=1 Tax=Phenylobacterium sp. TaxID=1871053 RepID=UPI002F4055F1
MKSTLIAAVAAAALVAGAAGVSRAAAPPAYVAKAVADPSRPKNDVAQDANRAPAETLAFAGVKPGMTVDELFPGGGYFTRMLSDVVGPGGKVMGVENAGWKGAGKADQDMIASLAQKNVDLQIKPFGQMDLPAGKADVFWITQNYHDLKIAKYGVVDMAAFNKAVFAALKPGGTYFILDHQANPGITTDEIAKLHRVEKATVVREVTAAGFRLVGEGKFLNRPGDDHTKEIFDPAIRFKTDQYALKFVKPA